MKHVYLLALTLCTLLLCVAADLAPALRLENTAAFFPKSDSLYHSVSEPTALCNCATGELVFSLDSCRFHFGVIKGNPEQIQLTFYAKNTGSVPVIITNATTSCGCDVPGWCKEPVLPGHTTRFTYTYDSKRIGLFKKTMCIFYGQHAQVLVMDGQVQAYDVVHTGEAFSGTLHFEKDFAVPGM